MTSVEKLLQKSGYSIEDVKIAFEKKIHELENKKIIRENVPLEGVKERKTGRFVTLIQSDYPLKMFVLQEVYVGKDEPEIRIGYYIVSKKMLEKGKLSLQWGQFNPNIPKKDLMKLIEMAKRKSIL